MKRIAKDRILWSREDNAHWIAADETITIHGYPIKGGLFYVGSRLISQTGEIEPALINPQLPLSSGLINLSRRLTEYWPSFHSISPEARAAYIRWLHDGRKDPIADIGYVFLFFYGLERRALVDAPVDPEAKKDIPHIIAEVGRLLSIYSTNGSFQSYAQRFLETLKIQAGPGKLYNSEAPTLSADCRTLPFDMQIGLGQLAMDGKPIPIRWACVWAFTTAGYTQCKQALRCPEVLERLFSIKYKDCFGEGLKLPINRTKLRLEYNPASPGIMQVKVMPFPGDLPDVQATLLAVNQLLPVFNACLEELTAYRRYVARHAGRKDCPEVLLALPFSLWPNHMRTELESLRSQIASGQLLINLGELWRRLKDAGSLTRSKMMALGRALESLQIGMEPDVLAGARMPHAEEVVCLFLSREGNLSARFSAEYRTAAIIIKLACAVVQIEGRILNEEISCLLDLVDSWQHLAVPLRHRLKASVHLRMRYSDKLFSIKRELKSFTEEAKHSIARHAVYFAQVNGVVSPSKVELLEKIYRVMGVASQRLYSDLHAGGFHTGMTAKASVSRNVEAKPDEGRILLDVGRIAELRTETERLSALLAGVFSSDEPPHGEADNKGHDKEKSGPRDTLLLQGLDAEHRAFVQVLNSRSTWSRSDLSEIATEMELSLDGALERINELALDRYGEPFFEGENLIRIKTPFRENLAA